MQSLVARAQVIALLFLTEGCCALAPCHPATSLVGTVTTVGGLPVGNAMIALYGSSVVTAKSGCFRMSVSDGIPFNFTVTAKGYKPVEMKAKRGIYRVATKLALDNVSEQSRTEWSSISEGAFHDATPCE